MSNLRFKISMSLDGFVAGPGQSVDNRSGSAACVYTGGRFHSRPGGRCTVSKADGIEAALARARRAAGGKDVSLAGGASAAQQYVAAGLVDEMEISVVPTLLGNGERRFDGGDGDLHGLELVRTVAAPNVTHLEFARR